MSKKYVIEINPEYEDTTKGVMVLGARESNLYVDTLSIEDLEELNSDYINEHYGELQDEAYQRGLEDAWEAAWLIFNMSDEDAMEAGLDTAFNLSASEAIAKMKAYEEKQKEEGEIKVGDEVEVLKTGSKYLIAWISGSTLCGFSYAGITRRLQPSDVRKTGRHFDIEGIMEAIKNG